MSNYPIKDLHSDGADRKVPQTRTARLARARLGYLLHGFADEDGLYANLQRLVPEAWATLADDLPCAEPRVKMTLRVDRSVAAFYRAMGKGYQARMNRVLATYAQMQIGQVEREHEAMADLLRTHGADRVEGIARGEG